MSQLGKMGAERPFLVKPFDFHDPQFETLFDGI